MLGQSVVTEIQVLHLLAILTDRLHCVGQLAPVNIDVAEAQLLNVRHRVHHLVKRIHEDELVEGQITKS